MLGAFVQSLKGTADHWGGTRATYSERRQLVSVGVVGLLVATAASPYILIFKWIGATAFANAVILIVSSMLGSFWLARAGYARLSANLCLTVCNFGCYLFVSGLGNESGIPFLYFVFAAMPVMFFGSQQLGRLVVWNAITVILTVLNLSGHGLDHWYPGFRAPGLESSYAWLQPTIGATTFLLLAMCILALQKIAEEGEKRILQLQAMTRLSSLGEMAAGIAHEINNPLTVVAMGLQHAMEDPEMATPERFQRLLRNTNRIARIVQEMRTLCQNPENVQLSAVSLSDAVTGSLELCAHKFEDQGISVELLGLGQPRWVRGNSTQISQVIVNLLNNARDALDGCTHKSIRIECMETPQQIELRFQDSGVGIPTAVRAKLFQPFFTTKPVGKGTGLGLSTSANIMKIHGGSLDLEPEPATTCFVMRFPRPHLTAPIPSQAA